MVAAVDVRMQAVGSEKKADSKLKRTQRLRGYERFVGDNSKTILWLKAASKMSSRGGKNLLTYFKIRGIHVDAANCQPNALAEEDA